MLLKGLILLLLRAGKWDLRLNELRILEITVWFAGSICICNLRTWATYNLLTNEPIHQIISIVALLIIVLITFTNHQLIDTSCILQYLIINQPLLLYDPLVILNFLLLPLHDILKILFLGWKTWRFLPQNVLPANYIAQVVKALLTRWALRVWGGGPRVDWCSYLYILLNVSFFRD